MNDIVPPGHALNINTKPPCVCRGREEQVNCVLANCQKRQ